jgi:outer membrane protein TolC
MLATASFWHRLRTKVLLGLSAPLLLHLPAAGLADSLPAAEPAEVIASTPPASQPLGLHAARALAVEHNPSVAAAHATYHAALARQAALDNLLLPRLAAPDLPIRRKQASLGVQIAQAGISRAKGEVVYGVNFSYWSVLYASDQERLMDEVLEKLGKLKDPIQKAITTGSSPIPDTRDIDSITMYQEFAASARAQASVGKQRGLSALREAVGLDPTCSLILAQSSMPELQPALDRQALLHLACAHRAEMFQASLLADVVELEVSAQQAVRLQASVKTFASGSDIHAQPLPSGTYDEGYVPGPIGPEMPPFLNGCRKDRVHQAQIYHERTLWMADKVRRLIVLQVDQAFLRYQEASERRRRLSRAAKLAQKESQTRQDSYLKALQAPMPPRPGSYSSLDEVLEAGRRATELRSEANRALYDALLALAALEKATGGAFQVGFPEIATRPADEEPTGPENNETRNSTPGSDQTILYTPPAKGRGTKSPSR